MTDNPILLFLILWPMAGGVLSYVAGRYSRSLDCITGRPDTVAFQNRNSIIHAASLRLARLQTVKQAIMVDDVLYEIGKR